LLRFRKKRRQPANDTIHALAYAIEIGQRNVGKVNHAFGEILFRMFDRIGKRLHPQHDIFRALFIERRRLQNQLENRAERLIDIKIRIAPCGAHDIEFIIHALHRPAQKEIIDTVGNRPAGFIQRIQALAKFFLRCVVLLQRRRREIQHPAIRTLDAVHIIAGRRLRDCAPGKKLFVEGLEIGGRRGGERLREEGESE